MRERALELLHEVAGLLEQLLGEVSEDEGDSPNPAPNVEPEATSPAVSTQRCPLGGDHVEINVSGNTYCGRCNALLATEE